MLRFYLVWSIALFFIHSAHGFDDVDRYQQRLKDLDNFKQSEVLQITEDADKKIKYVSTIQHPYLLNYDKKIQEVSLKVMNDKKNEMNNEVNSISFNHVENLLKKFIALKEQQKEYNDAIEKSEELKKLTSNSKNLQKYMELMSIPTTTVQDAVIEGRYLILSKDEKAIADEFKKNIFIVQRNRGIQESLAKDIKETSFKIEENLKVEEDKVKAVNNYKTSIDEEYKKISKHIENFEDNYQFSWNLTNQMKQDKMGGFSCDPKVNAKYLRFKNYPNLIAFNNGKDYKTIISLDKENPTSFNQVYTCTPGEYGCFDKKEPALCGLDPECKTHLDAALAAYKVDGYQVFKKNLLTEIIERNKTDHFKEGNLISEFYKMKKINDEDIKKLKELHDSIGAELLLMNNKSPEEFHKEVKKKIDAIVETEKSKPKLSSEAQKGFIFMLQGIKSKVGELKTQYFIEMNSYKYCPGQSESSIKYCESYAAYQKSLAKFNEVEEIENLSVNECPIVSFRLQKTGLPSQEECTIKPIVNELEDIIKIQEVLKKSN